MKKKDILKLIKARQTINNNAALLSTIENTYFHTTSYINESRWYPNITELKPYFDILKEELLKAKNETEKAKKIIAKSQCPHEVRLKYHSLFVSSNACVLCGKSVSSDNLISFKESLYRNKHTVTFTSKYQSDEDGEYIIEDGKTNDDVLAIILDIIAPFNDEDDIDLVQEFAKLNLPNVDINLEKRKTENYILIIGGTNQEYLDNEHKVYVTQNDEFDYKDIIAYFYELINTKIAIIAPKDILNDEKIKEIEDNHSQVFYQDYTTLGYLDTAIYQVKNIPFKLIIDVSNLYNYEIIDNQIVSTRHNLNLQEKFPNSNIIRINPVSDKDIEVINLNTQESKIESTTEACNQLKRLIRK